VRAGDRHLNFYETRDNLLMKAVLVFFPFLRVRVGVGSKRSCGEAAVVTRRLRDRFTMTAGMAAVGRT
jgi:hypothetical protein